MPFPSSLKPVAETLEWKAMGWDSAGRRWNSALHPRDSKGRFIETGGIVRVGFSGQAKVLRALVGKKIEVEFPNGRRQIVPTATVTMVRRPDGSKPTKDARKVLAEDEARAAHPERGDGLNAPDPGDPAVKLDLENDPQDEDEDNDEPDADLPEVTDSYEPSRTEAKPGDWVVLGAKAGEGGDSQVAYTVAEVATVDDEGKPETVRVPGSKTVRPRSSIAGDGDADTLIPREDIGDVAELERQATGKTGGLRAMKANTTEDLIGTHLTHKVKAPAGTPAVSPVTTDELVMARDAKGVLSKDGLIAYRGKTVGRIVKSDTKPGKWRVEALGGLDRDGLASWDNAHEALARHLTAVKAKTMADRARKTAPAGSPDAAPPARVPKRKGNGTTIAVTTDAGQKGFLSQSGNLLAVKGDKGMAIYRRSDSPEPDADTITRDGKTYVRAGDAPLPEFRSAWAGNPEHDHGDADKDAAPDAAATPVGPTDADKITNAEKMYGTGSPEHLEAQRRFGQATPDQAAPVEAIPAVDSRAVTTSYANEGGLFVDGGQIHRTKEKRDNGNGMTTFVSEDGSLHDFPTNGTVPVPTAEEVDRLGVVQAKPDTAPPTIPTADGRSLDTLEQAASKPNASLDHNEQGGLFGDDKPATPKPDLRDTIGGRGTREAAAQAMWEKAKDANRSRVQSLLRQATKNDLAGALTEETDTDGNRRTLHDLLAERINTSAATAPARPSTTPEKDYAGDASTTPEGAPSEPVRGDRPDVVEEAPAAGVRDDRGGREDRVLRESGEADRGLDRVPDGGQPAGSEPTERQPGDEGTQGRDGAGEGRGRVAPGAAVPQPGERTTERAGDDGARTGGTPRAVAAPEAAATDYKPESQGDLVPSSEKDRVAANMAALRLLRKLEGEGRPATPEEQRVLAAFGGWGALPKVFVTGNDTYAAERAEMKDLMSPEDYEDAMTNALNAHYTDAELVKPMWAGLEALGFTGGDVLEAGSGTGNFIGFAPDGARMHGVEKNAVTAGIAKLLYPSADVRHESFGDTPVRAGQYDAMIGNVPFGNFAVHDPAHNPKNAMKIHDHFIAKGITGLKPGGIAAIITSAGTMDKQNSQARRKIAEHADLIGAVRLPGNAHKAAAGTDVVTDMLIFRKRKDGEAPGDQSWVESTEGTLDDGTTRSINRYFQDHPENILGTTGTDSGRFAGSDALAVKGNPQQAPVQLAERFAAIVADAKTKGLDYSPEGDSPAPAKKAPARKPLTGLKNIVAKATPGSFTEPSPRTQRRKRIVGQITHTGSEKVPGKRTGSKGSVRHTFTMTDFDGTETEYVAPGSATAGEVTKDGKMPSQADELVALLRLRDVSADLRDAERESQEDTPEILELRKEMNRLYDGYVEKYGAINRTKTLLKKKAVKDPTDENETDGLVEGDNGEWFERVSRNPEMGGIRKDPTWWALTGLESDYNEDTETATKAKTFTQRVIGHRELPAKADNPRDAIAISREHDGKIDVPRIANLLGVSEDDALAAMDGLVYTDPDTNELVPAHLYLSGEVRKRARRMAAMAAEDPRWEPNARALAAVVPPDKDPTKITTKLGAAWIEPRDFEAFVHDLTGNTSSSVEHKDDGTWVVNVGSGGNRNPSIEGGSGMWAGPDHVAGTPLRAKWGTSRRNSYQLVEAALRGNRAEVKDKDIEGREYLNQKETEAANAVIDSIQKEFAKWLWREPARRDRLHQAYNDRYRAHTDVNYVDSPMGLYPGMSDAIDLDGHQNDAVAMAKDSEAVLLHHEVGVGKTFTMAAAIMEKKRLGQVSKPVLVVPNHMLEQFVREFKMLYPDSNLLADDGKTGGPDGRRRFVAQAAGHDWDAVVMTKSAFGRLPLSESTMVESIEADLDKLREQRDDALAEGKTAAVKKFGAQIEARRAKLKDLQERLNSDTGALDFETAGFDYVVVDEAHEYKNDLVESSIRGLAKATPNLQAVDLRQKLDFLRARNKETGRNSVALFATGTPVSNSTREFFVMMRFLRPDLLEDAGVADFDDFAKTFLEMQESIEPSVTGKIQVKMREGDKLVNAGEMKRMWVQFTDEVTADDVGIERPKLVGGSAEKVVMPVSENQQKYVEHLAYRRTQIKPTFRPEPGDDTVVAIGTDGLISAVDLRLLPDRKLLDAGIDPAELTDADSKVPVVGDSILAEWKRTKDLTFKVKRGSDEDHPVKGALQVVFSDKGTPKAEAAKHTYYQALKDYLVAGGMSPDEIAFIHDANGDQVKLGKITDRARTGEVKVLIGSTAKMGTGLNVQNRLSKLHHVDGAYRPDQIEQRNGRAIRRGNQLDEVSVAYYPLEGSTEGFQWAHTARKDNFLRQFAKADLDATIVGNSESETATESDMLKALAAGNPLLMDQAQVDVAHRKMRDEADSHDGSIEYHQSVVTQGEAYVRRTQDEIKDLEAAEKLLTDTAGEKFAFVPASRYNDRGRDSDTIRQRKDAAAVLAEKLEAIAGPNAYIQAGKGRETFIGTMGGLDVYAHTIKQGMGRPEVGFSVAPSGGSTYTPKVLNTAPVRVDPRKIEAGTITRLENLVASLPARRETLAGKVEAKKAEMEVSKVEGSRTFEMRPELDALTARKESLAHLMRLTAQEKPNEKELAAAEADYNTKTQHWQKLRDERLSLDAADKPVEMGAARTSRRKVKQQRAEQARIDRGESVTDLRARKEDASMAASGEATERVGRARPATPVASVEDTDGTSGGSAPRAPRKPRDPAPQTDVFDGPDTAEPAAEAPEVTPDVAEAITETLDNPDDLVEAAEAIEDYFDATEPVQVATTDDAPEPGALVPADDEPAGAVTVAPDELAAAAESETDLFGEPIPVETPTEPAAAVETPADQDGFEGMDDLTPTVVAPEPSPAERESSTRTRAPKPADDAPDAQAIPFADVESTPDAPTIGDAVAEAEAEAADEPLTVGPDDLPAVDEEEPPKLTGKITRDEADEATTGADTDGERIIPPAPVSEEHAEELDYEPKTPTQLEGEKYPLTTQQQKIADAVVADSKDTLVKAKAGTGKTSTLEAIARRMQEARPKDKIVYIAFNKSVQVEADGRMPANVEPRTGHSLAWSWAGREFTAKKDRKDLLRRGDQIADFLKINEGPGDMEPAQAAQSVIRTVDRFANSADDKIGLQHLPESLADLDDAEKRQMVKWANKAWDDLRDKDGKINMSFDHIRKMWALSKPDLTKTGSGVDRKANVLFLDEAQDTPPVLAKVVADQKMQKVIVGDADQAIYGFTGATDYLATADHDIDLPLTKSWRFGPEIADWGNKFLQVLGSDERVEGGGAPSRIVADMDAPDAILVRSNGGMIGEILREQQAGRSVGVPKGTKQDLRALVDSARYLKGEGPAPERMHEDLAPYLTWAEVEAESAKGDDPKLAMLTKIVDDFGVDELDTIVSSVREMGDSALGGVTFRKTDVGLQARGKTYEQRENLKAAGFRFMEIPGEKITAGRNKGQPLKAWVATGTEAEQTAKIDRLKELAGGEQDVDVMVSTAHKSKGLEWDRVRIGSDFRGPTEDKLTGELVMPADEELRLAYVAVTRAGKELDPGSLAWVESYAKDDETGDNAQDTPAVVAEPAAAAPAAVTVAPEDLPTLDGVTPVTPEAADETHTEDDLEQSTGLEDAPNAGLADDPAQPQDERDRRRRERRRNPLNNIGDGGEGGMGGLDVPMPPVIPGGGPGEVPTNTFPDGGAAGGADGARRLRDLTDAELAEHESGVIAALSAAFDAGDTDLAERLQAVSEQIAQIMDEREASADVPSEGSPTAPEWHAGNPNGLPSMGAIKASPMLREELGNRLESAEADHGSTGGSEFPNGQGFTLTDDGEVSIHDKRATLSLLDDMLDIQDSRMQDLAGADKQRARRLMGQIETLAEQVRALPDPAAPQGEFVEKFSRLSGDYGTVRTTNGGEISGRLSSNGSTYSVDVETDDGRWVHLPSHRVQGVRFHPAPESVQAAQDGRWNIPEPTAYSDSNLKNKKPLARALTEAAGNTDNTDDRTALEFAAQALTDTGWASGGGPEGQGRTLAELDQDVLDIAGMTHEDLDNRIRAIGALADHLESDTRGDGAVSNVEVAAVGEDHPKLVDYLRRYTEGYNKARSGQAFADDVVSVAPDELPTVDSDASYTAEDFGNTVADTFDALQAGDREALAEASPVLFGDAAADEPGTRGQFEDALPQSIRADVMDSITPAAEDDDRPALLVNGVLPVEGMDLPWDGETGDYSPEQIDYLAENGVPVAASIDGGWQLGHFVGKAKGDSYTFRPAGGEDADQFPVSRDDLDTLRVVREGTIPGTATDPRTLREGTQVLGRDMDSRRNITGVLAGVSEDGRAMIRDGLGDLHRTKQGDTVRPIHGAYAPGAEPAEAAFTPEAGVWTPAADGVIAAGVPGEWVAGIRDNGDGTFSWRLTGAPGSGINVESGEATSLAEAKAAVADALLGAAIDSNQGDVTMLPGDDTDSRDRNTAELDETVRSFKGDETTVGDEPTDETAGAPDIQGAPAGWVPTGELEPGDIAQVDGDNGNGSATTRVGHVLGTPEPVTVHEPGKAPRKGTRTTVGQTHDGVGDRETVLSPAESVAARATRDEDAGSESNPQSAPESVVLAGRAGDRVPVDANGAGVFPGSVVTRGDQSGYVTETDDLNAMIRWSGKKHDETVRAGLLTVDADQQNRPHGWTRNGQQVKPGHYVETPDGHRGTVESLSGDDVEVLTPDGLDHHNAGDLTVVGQVVEGSDADTGVREPTFDTPVSPEGPDVRSANPVKPDALPDDVATVHPNLKPEHLRALNDLGLDTDATSPYDVQQAAARLRHGQPISAQQAHALAEYLGKLGVPGARGRGVKRAQNRIQAAGDRIAAPQAPATPAEPAPAAEPELAKPFDLAHGDVIALPDPETGEAVWGTVETVRPQQNGQTAGVSIVLPNGDVHTAELDAAEGAVYRLPDVPEDTKPEVAETSVVDDRPFTEPRVAERVNDSAAAVTAAATGEEAPESLDELAERVVENIDAGADRREQRNASNRLETSLEQSGVDEDTAQQVHEAAERAADRAAEQMEERLRNTAADFEPLPGESDADAAARWHARMQEAADEVDTDDIVDAVLEQTTPDAETNDGPTPTEQAHARKVLADSLRADLFSFADQLAALGDTENANTLSQVAARLAGHPDPVHVEEAVAAVSMGRGPSKVRSLAARIRGMFARSRRRLLDKVKSLMGTGRKAKRSFKAAVAAARSEWKHDDKDLDNLIADAAEHLTQGGDKPDTALVAEPTSFGERVGFWREQLPASSAEFGQTRGRSFSFGRLTGADLDGPLAAQPVEGMRLDRAPDGGPGQTATAHLEALHGLGAALDDEAHARVRATMPELGENPAETVAEARRYAEQVAREERGDRSDAELAKLRTKAKKEADDLHARYVNAMAESVLAVLAEQRSMGPRDGARLSIEGRGEDADEVAALRWAEKHLPSEWLAAMGPLEAKAGRVSEYAPGGNVTIAPLGASERDGAGEYGASALHALAHHAEASVPGLKAAEWAQHWKHTSDGDAGRRNRRGKHALTRLRDLFPAVDLGECEVARPGSHPSPWHGQEHDGGHFESFALAMQEMFAGQDVSPELRHFIMGVLGFMDKES